MERLAVPGSKIMKLNAILGEEVQEILLDSDGNHISAEIDGRHYELESSEPESGVYILKHENRVYEAYVSPEGSVTISGRQFDIKISDPKRLRGKGDAHEHGDGMAEIKTAMPGKIVRILVAVGDTVKKGDGVIVVEAMKMQNEMKSPKAGSVKEIRFTEGSTVNAGDILALIE
jgi:biotin carboxyl carrier protein